MRHPTKSKINVKDYFLEIANKFILEIVKYFLTIRLLRWYLCITLRGPMRITTENRTRLETVIPLSTPYVIFIDPANVCNQKCSYCPTGHPDLLKGTYRKPAIMDWDHCSYEGEEMIDYRVGAI